MKSFFLSRSIFRNKGVLLILGLVISVVISLLTVQYEAIGPLLVISLCLVVIFTIFVFRNPRNGLIFLIYYCFLMFALAREMPGIPYGIGVEVILILTLFACLLYYNKADWASCNNDLFKLLMIWFAISVIEVANPAGASINGWFHEIRSVALYPLLIVVVGLMIFKTERDLNTFLYIIIGLALLSAFNGIKQLHIGLSPGDQSFLDNGGAVTHIVAGKLRIFSFYDAAQFGASQAQFVVIAITLALGPFKSGKKALMLFFTCVFFYAMIISGTRGALFVLVVGMFMAIFLSKNFKVLIIGGALAVTFIAGLKYTTIGNNYYEIYRLRTALDPKDPSLNLRFMNQEIIAEYLKTRPFGGGLGVIGIWGKEYNADKFLSTIEPDSYWVKIWAMYGIVGFMIWFCMMMYIFGKCCGIIWKTRDDGLRVKLIALLSGAGGVFFCSYGNEIINNMPSSIVVCLSWVFIYISPRIDAEICKRKLEQKVV
uniref:O-antigen ligase family protein n=1 Tax=Pedobacter schmidteae TaxID=2201271 RepID=UPI000EB470DC|nr:O-antigen ligase family protein [Pedobacter schmidteae]